MDLDNFILKFDQNYSNLFIENSNDQEAHGERFQKTVEIYIPTGKRNKN